MPFRTAPLAFLLAAALAACDTAEVEPPPAPEVAVGATYEGTRLALRDARTGRVAYDYLADGAEISVTFESAGRFSARLFVPYEALVASGETDDLDGDVDEALAGTYRQRDGALTFTPDEFADTFFTDAGWTVEAAGRTVRYESSGVEVVLTRR